MVSQFSSLHFGHISYVSVLISGIDNMVERLYTQALATKDDKLKALEVIVEPLSLFVLVFC